ncbi:hypothetical protein [Natronococcus sp. A-GB7]|uniref:hypothetical protein n=1 Tax=Natronococcus sp. A-GB7 TaxID=3037649 RepID=UPI00241E4C88|nr:hypothetical protein [Natronococcus sp. A-GB7]MDG5818982.1 hypothetical protein [Natronococcus sp. A-GB7]
MSREAARAGFETFVDRTIDATRREFSVGRALRGSGLGLGGTAVDLLRKNADGLERAVVEPELATYRRRSLEQFDIVLEYVDGDAPIEEFADELLARDSYVEALRPDVPPARRRAVREEVLERLARLGDGIEPIVERPETGFWPAVRAAFDRDDALELVEEAFPFTGPLGRHRDAFVFAVELDPGEFVGGPFAAGLPTGSIEYTDEAIRAMEAAERRIVRETRAEVGRRFDGAP